MKYCLSLVTALLARQCGFIDAGLYLGDAPSPGGDPPSMLASASAEKGWDHSSQGHPRDSWTVIHTKRKHSQIGSFLSMDAQDDPTMQEQIDQMGRDLCKAKPNDPKCKQFAREQEEGHKKEEAQQEELTAASTETPAKATDAPAEETAAHTEAPAKATVAPAANPAEASESKETMGKPHTLPSQGFEGKKVRYENGKDMTSDWHDEYEIATTKEPKPEAPHSGVRAHLVPVMSIVLFMLCLVTQDSISSDSLGLVWLL